jgi:hypothetical protein
MRRVSLAVLLAVLVLLMTGCIKFDVDLKVSPDDKVSGTVIVAFDRNLLSLTGQTPEQVIQGSGVSVPAANAPGTSVTPYQDDTFAGETIAYDDVDLSEFNQGGADDSLKIEHVGDEFHVSGTVDFSAPQGGAKNPFGSIGTTPAQLRITLAFPGAVSSSNGQVSGNAVTWTPTFGQKTELTAVASAIGPSNGALWIWVIVGTAIVAAVVVVLVVLRRRRTAPEAAPPVG